MKDRELDLKKFSRDIEKYSKIMAASLPKNSKSLKFQSDLKIFAEELQTIVDYSARFTDDILPQIGGLTVQNFCELNELLILLRKYRSDK